MNLFSFELPMCAWWPQFYFCCNNFCFIYCSNCCPLDPFVIFWFVAYLNLCYFTPLLFGTSTIWNFVSFMEMNLFCLSLRIC